MKNYFCHGTIALLLQLLWASTTFAGGYLNYLYLCDMGLLNPDRSNALGVDYVEYVQNGKNRMMRATPNGASALSLATQTIPGYDRWNRIFGIDNVSFNLDSDFFGSQYYLEYCYTWDRQVPFDTVQYSILFKSSLSAQVPNTEMETNSKCSVKSKSGYVSVSDYPQTSMVQMLLSPDQISMRCTIRLTFKETSGNIRRPHNNDLGAVDPNVFVKVEP